MATTDSTPQAQTEQPAPSAPEGQDSSQEVRITKAEWDNVKSLLGRIPDLQGGRDIAKQTQKEISGLRSEILPLLERAHALGSENKPLNDALNVIQNEQSEMEFRKAVMEIAQNMRSGTQPTGTGNAPGVDVAAVFAEYQLDLKDPYVAGRLAGQSFTSKEQAELAAARILRDKTLAPQTNPAQQSATPGNSGGGTSTEPMAKLQELMKDPVRNRKEIAEVKKQLGW
jgi:regulator of replication initiation timing